MKRWATFILFVSLCMLMGCESSTIESDKITEKKVEQISEQISIEYINFDSEEYSIMKAAGTDHVMIFSIDYGNVNVENISYWIDHYRDGEFSGTMLDMGSQITTDTKSKLYFSTINMDTKQELWNMALRQNGNISSGKQLNTNMDFDSTITEPIIQNTSADLNQVIDLGMMIRNKDKNSFGSHEDMEKTIEQNKDVYILRCKIS
ncbi:hypothetical protein J45TS6_30780 [Paenibacillus sp. J45TS6]|uniref:hypothetical protein n=1 Tax=Paenibacillus sp. J45TS6 TaxID=2807196 RepID=UPI001B20B173|nr:hypothetical protein [Paenibacillus sp. J45TS6]GIP44619.1 hypothetical protein J45TS6_30780 [Paenibacillus sp. J45TS6]